MPAVACTLMFSTSSSAWKQSSSFLSVFWGGVYQTMHMKQQVLCTVLGRVRVVTAAC
jgi:hypothetical protein